MDRISAPEQNRLLGRLADMLRMTEGQAAAPEFLPPQLNVMNLVRQLMLPSAETVEKMSYGDPLFRMPQQSRIPITADKEYLADIAGMVPFTAPAARPSARAMQDLVREIQTTPPVGAVNIPQTPSVPKSDIGFYSQLEAAVQPLQNKGTGQQYLAQIQKTPGVKPEELQWTGLDTFLKGRQSVTKQDIQDYLSANRVNVQEVRLGTPQALEARNQQIAEKYGYQAEFDNGEIAFFDPKIDDYVEFRDLPMAMRTEISNPQVQFGGTTKFSSYTLPGGENYREILLTLPEKTRPVSLAEVNAERAKISPFLKPLDQAQYDALVQSGEIGRVGLGGQQYRSSHFDQPNILAHMRVNDRVVDGKKTLFIEEIQSDWHQAGRKKGYASKENLESWYNQNKLENDPPFANLSDEQLRVIEANRSAGMGGSNLVPDAPFKTSWHELTLKRAIQEASEKGYDQIAFTTGKTQAERYDLSKQVDRIAVPMVNPDSRSVRIETPNGFFRLMVNNDGVVGSGSSSQFLGKGLDEVVGKEMAEKIMSTAEPKDFSGLDLQVGGEGMKGFYDNILPKSLEKLGKKFDAKVNKTEMDGVEVWQMDITPKMRESVTTKGQPLFAVPAIGTGLLGAGMMQEEEQF